MVVLLARPLLSILATMKMKTDEGTKQNEGPETAGHERTADNGQIAGLPSEEIRDCKTTSIDTVTI
jgi:hypothetical protein